jgi:fumarate hydratase subunit alpha
MRTIAAKTVTGTVKRLCIEANLELRSDVVKALRAALKQEAAPRARRCLRAIIDNAAAARRKKLAICQDTGLPSVFIELGSDAHIAGDLAAAVRKGIEQGYAAGYFRKSIVPDPLKRGIPGFVPGVLHTDIVRGSRMKITVLAKGFGCENKSSLRMFNPTAQPSEIGEFVVNTVKAAGADACPPYVIGVGIGGTADYACLLAKKALLRRLGAPSRFRSFEKEFLRAINKLAIGPMGMGGKTTALAVAIEAAPTHIAGLPVAVSISCHALRSAAAVV